MKLRIVCAATMVYLSTTLYPAAGIVTEVRPDGATVTTATGIAYEVDGDDWVQGDLCAMIMHRTGNQYVMDDEVVASRYVGALDMFEEVAK